MAKTWVNDPEDDEAFRQLWRLRILMDQGWVKWRAFHGLHGWAGHRLGFTNGADLAFKRDEIRWVSIGYSHGIGQITRHSALLSTVDRHAVPDIVPLDEAARVLGVDEETVVKRERAGAYYRVTSYRPRSRVLFRLEIDPDPASLALWRDLLNRKLPELSTVDELPPRPDEPKPAVDPQMWAPYRRQELLKIARGQGWLKLVRNLGTQYTLHLPDLSTGGIIEQVTPAEGLEPYVWGVGLAHGRHDLVTYRHPL